ncbi:MAG: GNAT family N-acetyltransferase [Candidatus Hodarchaeota archaeon]
MKITLQILFEDPNEEILTFLKEQWKSANLLHFGRDISDEFQPLNIIAFTESTPQKIAGVARCIIMGNTLRVSQLLVREEYRKTQGVGSLILKRLEKLAHENKWHKIRLSTIHQNLNFYLKNGYSIEATLANDAFNSTWYILSKFIIQSQKKS